MRNALVCCALLVMFFASGCVVRTYTTEMDRVDQEIYGNRGVIFGTPPAVEETSQIKKTRKIYNMEVEVPSVYKAKARVEQSGPTEDKELYGNRGYLQGSMAPEKEVYVSQGREERVSSTTRLSGGGADNMKMPQIVYSEPSSGSDTGDTQKQYYVVQKGDTLQKISEKFFGTTQKWKVIYNANKNILKSPDRIRPGQKLFIPNN